MSPARTTTRREWLLAALGIVLLAAGAYFVSSSHGAAHDTVLAEACRAPVRVLEPQSRQAGSAVVFHGLSANRQMMQTIGQWLAAQGLRVYLVDLPGHGDSTTPFSLARAEQCGAEVVELLARRSEIVPERTVLVGHSMGGAIAVRLADRLPTAATIALAPAPMTRPAGMPASMVRFTLPRRMPVNLLVVRGGWEPSATPRADEALLRAAGGERFEAEDFRQRRAFRFVLTPRATHASLLYDLRVERVVAAWARQPLGEPAQNIIRPPGAAVRGSLLGLAGLLLIFPLAASALASVFGTGEHGPAAAPGVGAVGVLLRWIVVSLVVVVVLRFWVPLRSWRMLTGDYLASFLLLAGIVLLPLVWTKTRALFEFDPRAVVMAGVLAFATAVAFALWLNWQLFDAWLDATRWRRFLPLILACWPYFLAESAVLGPPGSSTAGASGWRRFGVFLAMRLVVDRKSVV